MSRVCGIMFRRPIYHFCVRSILGSSNVRHSGSCKKPPICPPTSNILHLYCCSRCPPEPPIKWCPCPSKVKPAIPPNPCCPVYPKGNHRLYKYVFFLGSLPTILYQMSQVYQAACHHHNSKEPCRDFEYMRRRTKKFPWGEESLFHNEDVNHLPGECTSQPQPQNC